MAPFAFAIVESPARYTVCARFETSPLGALKAVPASASNETTCEYNILIFQCQLFLKSRTNRDSQMDSNKQSKELNHSARLHTIRPLRSSPSPLDEWKARSALPQFSLNVSYKSIQEIGSCNLIYMILIKYPRLCIIARGDGSARKALVHDAGT